MDRTGVLIAVLGVVVVWLGLVTVVLLRWRAERGEPVYRRLPNGRLRFEWSVNQAYRCTERSVSRSAERAAPPQAGPLRPRLVVSYRAQGEG